MKKRGLIFGNVAGLSLTKTCQMLESCANLRIPPFLQVYRDHDIYIRHNDKELLPLSYAAGMPGAGRRRPIIIEPCHGSFDEEIRCAASAATELARFNFDPIIYTKNPSVIQKVNGADTCLLVDFSSKILRDPIRMLSRMRCEYLAMLYDSSEYGALIDLANQLQPGGIQMIVSCGSDTAIGIGFLAQGIHVITDEPARLAQYSGSYKRN